MFWFRIDNRLVHGQIIEAWLPYLHMGNLVVLNDALATDKLQQQIMLLAVPSRVKAFFLPLTEGKKNYDMFAAAGESAIFLLNTCKDARRLLDSGVPIASLNIGNMHYVQGKKQLCAHVAASEEDMDCMRFFRSHGAVLDFRCVPGDIPIMEEW